MMATGAGTLAIGIVADTVTQRQRLRSSLKELGLVTCFCGSPAELYASAILPLAACWLVQLEDEEEHPEDWDLALIDGDAPVLLGLDPAPAENGKDNARWQRKLENKLERLLGPLSAPQSANAEPSELIAARQVWVLAASLGGPEAVKSFLDQLPPDLPVGFVYAQHIDGQFTDVLTRVLGRHAHYRLKTAKPGDVIATGEVVMLPVDHEWQIDRSGALEELPGPWPGPYGPSIDQVLLNMSNYYRENCHAIIFSGMGCDGAVAAPMLRAYGSRIWAQDSESCGQASMPESVAATGCVSFRGTPQQLAQKLVATLENTDLQQSSQPSDYAGGNP
ncbi:chemotaxis protein CheB [Marinobacter sp. ELB17]|uniref:chemotaxis protein CheB n=1 Tax=Marinobacter sp. ELB17 TaxID=270374 RepID=UPI0000F36E3B|nr:chemotaxis protein CheB [Marinobacter sp. ELB17]EBA01458.1 Chemotaxis response regulator containing a CheY-like receiver domain and a methylesterase domain [Marinobacter sp. ELB17]